MWVQGSAQRQGSLLYDGFVAPRDAWVTARLRALGAVVLGISNGSEFACLGGTTNLMYGPTQRPQDNTLTPGGSSGDAVCRWGCGWWRPGTKTRGCCALHTWLSRLY